jgi:hypothetical protein
VQRAIFVNKQCDGPNRTETHKLEIFLTKKKTDNNDTSGNWKFKRMGVETY